MPPKRTSTSASPAMNQAAIRQLIDDRVADALEAQAANMENTGNTNRNPEQAPVARKLGSSSLVRSTTPPPDYPFDKSIFAELDNSLWIIPRPLGSKPVLEEPNESDAHLWK
nr:hypothetical protein [Tanacetum cinerariifolium]